MSIKTNNIKFLADFRLRDPRLREAEQILNKKIADEAAWWASATYLTEPVDWSNRQTDKQLTSPKHSVPGLDTKPLPPIKTESMPSPISHATDLVKKVVGFQRNRVSDMLCLSD